MKKLEIFSKGTLRKRAFILIVLIGLVSCDDDFLVEEPKDFLSPDNTFVNLDGFEAGLTGLYNNARGYIVSWEGLHEKEWEVL